MDDPTVIVDDVTVIVTMLLALGVCLLVGLLFLLGTVLFVGPKAPAYRVRQRLFRRAELACAEQKQVDALVNIYFEAHERARDNARYQSLPVPATPKRQRVAARVRKTLRKRQKASRRANRK